MAEQPPAWLASLVEVVANCLEAHSPMGPLGFLYGQEEGLWELIVYPTPVELIGGETDGAVVIPGFSLDLHALQSAFEQVEAVQWSAQALGPHDLIGAHIALEGRYQGHQVWLQVLAEPPEDEEPGLRLDIS